jgi:hypothetical protein
MERVSSVIIEFDPVTRIIFVPVVGIHLAELDGEGLIRGKKVSHNIQGIVKYKIKAFLMALERHPGV